MYVEDGIDLKGWDFREYQFGCITFKVLHFLNLFIFLPSYFMHHWKSIFMAELQEQHSKPYFEEALGRH